MEAYDVLREICGNDYDKGYLSLLAQLTQVGDISREDFHVRINEILGNKDHTIIVFEDKETQTLIATGTLLIERKFTHSCGKVGHIEDIVVDSNKRNSGAGKRIVSHLMKIAQREGCYKVILDCSEKNAVFYEKLGLKRKELQMVKYFE